MVLKNEFSFNINNFKFYISMNDDYKKNFKKYISMTSKEEIN